MYWFFFLLKKKRTPNNVIMFWNCVLMHTCVSLCRPSHLLLVSCNIDKIWNKFMHPQACTSVSFKKIPSSLKQRSNVCTVYLWSQQQEYVFLTNLREKFPPPLILCHHFLQSLSLVCAWGCCRAPQQYYNLLQNATQVYNILGIIWNALNTHQHHWKIEGQESGGTLISAQIYY